MKANIKQPSCQMSETNAYSMLTEWRTDSLWQVSNVVMKHKSDSNERTFLILVVSLERSASASKPPESKKLCGMLWAMSANINLSVLEACTHTGPKDNMLHSLPFTSNGRGGGGNIWML